MSESSYADPPGGPVDAEAALETEKQLRTPGQHRMRNAIGGLILGITAADAPAQDIEAPRQRLMAAQTGRPPPASALAAEMADELTAAAVAAAVRAILLDDQRCSMHRYGKRGMALNE